VNFSSSKEVTKNSKINLLTSIVKYKSTQDSSNSFALTTTILEALKELVKATIQFMSSVLPSVSMKQLGSNWTDFH
jgi:hypothetical protein